MAEPFQELDLAGVISSAMRDFLSFEQIRTAEHSTNGHNSGPQLPGADMLKFAALSLAGDPPFR